MTVDYALLPLLSLDCLLVTAALAQAGVPLRRLLWLAAAETAAPLVGYALGELFRTIVPSAWSGLVSAVSLVLLGLMLWREAGEADEVVTLADRSWQLAMLAVAADEIGFGFVLPLLSVRGAVALTWIGLQAFAAVLCGWLVGRRFGRLPGWWGRASAACVLALGVWQAVSLIA